MTDRPDFRPDRPDLRETSQRSTRQFLAHKVHSARNFAHKTAYYDTSVFGLFHTCRPSQTTLRRKLIDIVCFPPNYLSNTSPTQALQCTLSVGQYVPPASVHDRERERQQQDFPKPNRDRPSLQAPIGPPSDWGPRPRHSQTNCCHSISLKRTVPNFLLLFLATSTSASRTMMPSMQVKDWTADPSKFSHSLPPFSHPTSAHSIPPPHTNDNRCTCTRFRTRRSA